MTLISMKCGFEWGNKVFVKSEVELQWETLFQCSNAMQCSMFTRKISS